MVEVRLARVLSDQRERARQLRQRLTQVLQARLLQAAQRAEVRCGTAATQFNDTLLDKIGSGV